MPSGLSQLPRNGGRRHQESLRERGTVSAPVAVGQIAAHRGLFYPFRSLEEGCYIIEELIRELLDGCMERGCMIGGNTSSSNAWPMRLSACLIRGLAMPDR